MNKARRDTLNAILIDIAKIRKKLDFSEILSVLGDVQDDIEVLKAGVEELRDEEQESFDNMPEGMQKGDKGSAMETAIAALESAMDYFAEAVDACNLDDVFGEIESKLDDADNSIAEAREQ